MDLSDRTLSLSGADAPRIGDVVVGAAGAGGDTGGAAEMGGDSGGVAGVEEAGVAVMVGTLEEGGWKRVEKPCRGFWFGLCNF